jgi:hypothetical protein
MDLPQQITSLAELHELHRYRTPPHSTTSQPKFALVVSIQLNVQRISASPFFELLSDLLSRGKIILSSLELLNCKLSPHFLSQLVQTIQPFLSTSFRLNLTGSCRKQDEIDALLQLNSPFLIGINLSTSSRVTITNLLSSYQQSNSLLSLSLDKISLAAPQDMACLYQLLTSVDCNLRELSMQSCGLSKNENNFALLMSSLAYNHSLVSLDISDNRIRDPTIAASCLHLLGNQTLKKLICEATFFSPEVFPPYPSFTSPHHLPSAIILSGFGCEVFLSAPFVIQRMLSPGQWPHFILSRIPLPTISSLLLLSYICSGPFPSAPRSPAAIPFPRQYSSRQLQPLLSHPRRLGPLLQQAHRLLTPAASLSHSGPWVE